MMLLRLLFPSGLVLVLVAMLLGHVCCSVWGGINRIAVEPTAMGMAQDLVVGFGSMSCPD